MHILIWCVNAFIHILHLDRKEKRLCHYIHITNLHATTMSNNPLDRKTDKGPRTELRVQLRPQQAARGHVLLHHSPLMDEASMTAAAGRRDDSRK